MTVSDVSPATRASERTSTLEQGSQARLRPLDGLRAVGALMVVLTHVAFQSGSTIAGPFAAVLGRLDVGVAIFFTLSGFLLFRPHVSAHLEGTPAPRTGLYLRRRALRILPVVWIATAWAAALVPTVGAPAMAYFEHALLVHIYVTDQGLVGLTQMWSLATEVAFYLLLPAAAFLLCRGGRGRNWVIRVVVACATTLVVSPLWMGIATAVDAPRARLWLPAMVSWFAMGMVLAVWHVATLRGVIRTPVIKQVLRRPGTVWSVAVGLLLIAATPLAGPINLESPQPVEAALKVTLYALIGLLVVAPAVCPGADSVPIRMLGSRPAHVLGDISYGVFAYHVIVLALVERWAGLDVFQGHFWLRLALTLAITLPLAAASYYGLERSIMYLGRSRPHVPAPRDAPSALSEH